MRVSRHIIDIDQLGERFLRAAEGYFSDEDITFFAIDPTHPIVVRGQKPRHYVAALTRIFSKDLALNDAQKKEFGNYVHATVAACTKSLSHLHDIEASMPLLRKEFAQAMENIAFSCAHKAVLLKHGKNRAANQNEPFVFP